MLFAGEDCSTIAQRSSFKVKLASQVIVLLKVKLASQVIVFFHGHEAFLRLKGDSDNLIYIYARAGAAL